MIKTAQQSLLDFLMDAVPSLKNLHLKMVNVGPNNVAAKKLYALWNDETNKVADRQYRRPPDMSGEDVRNLISIGFLAEHGSLLKVTQKGAETIKKMILSDSSSAFDNGISVKKADFDIQEKSRFYRMASRKEEILSSSPMSNWYKLAKTKWQ